MKRLFISVALLAALLAASIFNSLWVTGFSRGLIDDLQEAMTLAEQSSWSQAREKTEQAFRSWKEHALPLHIFLQHGDTDQILLSFHSVSQYLHLEESDQYTAANAQLICQLELLAEKEQPTLQNIF